MCEGDFRQDLYFRLNVVNIHLPPLRQRRGDILLLAQHFLSEMCQEHGKTDLKLDPELLRFLMAHDWPGNVRQLRNCIECMVVLARTETLTKSDLRLLFGVTSRCLAPNQDCPPIGRFTSWRRWQSCSDWRITMEIDGTPHDRWVYRFGHYSGS